MENLISLGTHGLREAPLNLVLVPISPITAITHPTPPVIATSQQLKMIHPPKLLAQMHQLLRPLQLPLHQVLQLILRAPPIKVTPPVQVMCPTHLTTQILAATVLTLPVLTAPK